MPEHPAVISLDRRGFLRSLGGGLAVLLVVDDLAPAQESGRAGRSRGRELPQNVAAWLQIAPDGSITGFTGKVEVGQNIRTSLSQAIADELRCSPGSIRLLMGDTDLCPWDMGTFGSRTTPTMAPEMRKMASTARETLISQAAKQWNVPPTQVRIGDGWLSAAHNKASCGEIAGRINWTVITGIPDHITLPIDWHIAGTSVPKINAREIVTGKHQYASDCRSAGMLYGRVLRPPSFDAKLLSADTTRAAQMPGVTVVRDQDFIGVAATDEQKAEKAILSIEAKWQEQKQIAAKDLFPYIKGHEPGLATVYTVAYIAHVPLEPRAAVAEFSGNHLIVRTGTQRPFGVREELAQVFKMPEQQVRVLMPDTGSAYGGKHSGECAIEAARIAKAAGKPVKLIWTREEEFTWAYFRPAGVIEVAADVDKQGNLQRWEFHNYMSGPSGLRTPYEVADKKELFHEVQSPLRDGSYRGLAATANHFARESYMDELAAAAAVDPLAFRLRNLKDERMIAVLKAAAERFGWGSRKPSATCGYGLACGFEKGGYVACCAEVSIGSGRALRVERVVEAWECGAIVNPEHLKNQVEGAIMMGLGGALFEAIDFADGRILNAKLSQYRVPRFSDVPKIEVLLLDRKDIPSAGAGETPIVGIAPAVGNAIFSATGIRVRSMPILPAFGRA